MKDLDLGIKREQMVSSDINTTTTPHELTK